MKTPSTTEKAAYVSAEVVVHLQRQAAQNLASGGPFSAEVLDLLSAAEDLRLNVPLFGPGWQDDGFETVSLVLQTTDHDLARVVARLRECRAVESAYVKPQAERP
jgi:hypothetical protein